MPATGVHHRRFVYALGYLMMSAAGVCAGVWPSPSVTSAAESSRVLLYTWDLVLLVGGITAAWGVASERWIGEYIGLPLLFAVFAVYGVASYATGRPTAAAAGSAFIAVALLLVGRWGDVAAVRRLTRDAATSGRWKSDDTTEPPGSP